MPIITVTVSANLAPAQRAEIAEGVSALTAKHLRKDPKITAVIVNAIDPATWFVGGLSLADQQLASYWLDIKVVVGTNTKDEKAAYLAAIYAFMAEKLGPLHAESYALVHEVQADAYGFTGLTQERRYIAKQLGVSL
ncbi:4-oxalocrotonate tautomerase family protein [Lacibacterium aquatile]|uniref:4-oxalocrotonate tautomerase family protein n=1 Tax=Lacibacterium aquatile TaxID=1168082 RepID=A0ABW5DNZ6_9PROT